MGIIRGRAAERIYAAARAARLEQIRNRKPGDPIPEADTISTAALAKAVKSSQRGRQAQHNGAEFESRVAGAAESAGILLFKIPNGVRWLAGGNRAPVKTPFDFAGCIISQAGRCIAFDCKSISPNSTIQRMRIGTDVVAPHQAAALMRLGQGGALAGLLVNCGPRNDVRWLDSYLLRVGDAISWDSPVWRILAKSPAVGLDVLLSATAS